MLFLRLERYDLTPVRTSWVKLTILKTEAPVYWPSIPAHTSQKTYCPHTEHTTRHCTFFKARAEGAAAPNSVVAVAEVHLMGTDCEVVQGEVTTVAGQAGVHGMQDGAALESQFDLPVHMSFHRQRDDLYIADNLNNALRKFSTTERIVSTVAGEPTPGEVVRMHGMGSEWPAAVVKPPKGQPIDKIEYKSRLSGPTTALIPSESSSENQLLAMDTMTRSHLFVLDLFTEAVDIQCASNSVDKPMRCSQVVYPYA